MKHLTAVLILGLASLLPAVHPAVAQSTETTAGEVVDAETLQAFVEDAKARIEDINASGQLLAPFLAGTAVEGDWKHGNTYLILLSQEGTVLFHAGDEAAGGRDLYALEDDRGNTVVQDLIAAADMGGGHVEYFWDNPAQEGDEDTAKIAYATSFVGRGYGNTIILIGGFYQDVSHIEPPGHDDSLIPHPEVTAADVTDRESLKAFVRGAVNGYVTALREHGTARYTEILNVFRAEEGDWRYDHIYLFIYNTNGDVVF